MDIHENARTLPHSRMLIVQRLATGWSVAAVAVAAGVTAKTVRKWRDRHAAEGEPGLADRSSRPHRSPTRLGTADEDAIETLRRQRLSSPAIARRLGRPVSTIGQVLRRRSLGRLSALDPRPPAMRYEREQPGELIHIDIKKLGRIDGIGHRITGNRGRPKATDAPLAAASAGNTCMWPSTTARAWPSHSCCPANASKTPLPSWKAALLGSNNTASPSSAS